MIVLAAAALAVLSVPLAGGKLSRLASLRLRWTPALLFALAAKVMLTIVGAELALLGTANLVHVALYVAALAFLWRNRRVPGLWLLGAGGLANFTAILANGGVMPASPAAFAAAGLVAPDGFSNSAPVSDASLWWLGDVFVWPAPLPLANVFSVGDVLLVVGLAVLLHGVCDSRLARWRRPQPVEMDAPVAHRPSSRVFPCPACARRAAMAPEGVSRAYR